jgi:hypothetical protein
VGTGSWVAEMGRSVLRPYKDEGAMVRNSMCERYH